MTTTLVPPDTAPISLADFKAQYAAIKPEIDAALHVLLERGAFIGGQTVTNFETDYAAYCGARFGVATSSGTTALHLALCALGIGPGDEVIAPAHTFIASVAAIAQCGARIVFADIDPETYTLDPESVANCITRHTRAVVPVHLYGHMADIDALRDVLAAADHEILLIEDAAHAHGAARDGMRAGNCGRAACFSFSPGTNLDACGDAGMVTTDDSPLAQRMRCLADHGRQSKYLHEQLGFNYRLDAIQAAVLSVKLAHLDDWTELRCSRARLYDNFLGHSSGVIIPHVAENTRHVYYRYVIQVENRDDLRNFLADRGIAAGVHYPVPLHQQPAVRRHGFNATALDVTEHVAQRIVSLPLYAEMTDDQVARVADAVLCFVNG